LYNKLTLLIIGIYFLIIRLGYQTDNRGVRNSINVDIVVYPFYHCSNTKDGLVAAN